MITIPAPVMKLGAKASKFFVKHGPKIMSVGGGLMAIGGAVMACEATTHADEVIERHKQKMAKIAEAKRISDEAGDGGFTEKDVKKSKAGVYFETAVDFAKLYGPSVAVGLSGVGMMQAAFQISEHRGAQTLAALSALDQAYNELLANNVENPEATAALPVEQKEFRVKKLPDVVSEGSDDADELVLQEYIPVEMFDILENDPFAIMFDSRSADWYDGNCFVLNASKINSTFNAFSLRRETGHDIWVNDIRRAFGVEEKALGWSHGYTAKPGDAIEYDIFPFVYDIIDGMIVGMAKVPGKDNEERIEVLKSIELSDGPDQYCVVIKLHGNTPNGNPRFIKNEVYGA